MAKRKSGIDIKTEAVAKRVVRGCGDQFRVLNNMLLDIQPLAKPAEFKAIRKAVGEALGRMTMEVLFPALERFPHLDKHGVLKGVAEK